MNRISELRKQNGLSQKELSRIVHIAQNTLSQYETGTRTIARRVIEELSDYFGVSDKYLLGLTEYQTNETEHSYSSNNLLTDITKIEQTDSVSDVNKYLEYGWKLLHIGQYASDYYGTQHSEIIYTLGWTGDPQNAVTFEDDPCPRDYVLNDDE